MNKGNCKKKVWDNSLLPQVILISSIKPISSSTSLRMDSVVYWKEDSSFHQFNQIGSGFEVTNDAAEHSVKLGSDYNEILTTNKQQRHRIIQVVEQTRTTY